MEDDGRDMVEVGASPFSNIEHMKKRAFLEAFIECGTVLGAAEAAGMCRNTFYTDQWKTDEQFQAAFKEAEAMAARGLVDEARRRAVQGVRQYKFTKDGEAMRHPEECECGHHVRVHARTRSSCTECSCEAFVGRPYYEHSYSDTMLIFLMKGQLPDVYGDRMRVEAEVKNLDISRLPDHLVARIAAGEPVMAVLASAAASMDEARAMIGPGSSDGDDDGD